MNIYFKDKYEYPLHMIKYFRVTILYFGINEVPFELYVLSSLRSKRSFMKIKYDH